MSSKIRVSRTNNPTGSFEWNLPSKKMGKDTLFFIQFNDDSINYKYSIPCYFKNKETSKSVSLMKSDLSYIPKHFTINTKNGSSYKFNVDFLKDTSSVIKSELEKDPNNLQYCIDIEDKDNVMKKFEDLFQCKKVSFSINEIPTILEISKTFNFRNFPMFMVPQLLDAPNTFVQNANTVIVDKILLANYLNENFSDKFSIVINGTEYLCNYLGVFSSSVIRELIEKNPEITKYEFNIEVDCNDFDFVKDLFDFKSIDISVNNMKAIRETSAFLGIDSILPQIDKFIQSYNGFVQIFDESKKIVNEIREIFDWLYNINSLTVERVTNNIFNSVLVQTEEDVKELISCMLHVIQTSYKLHPYMLDLALALDRIGVKILLPMLIKQVLINIGNNSTFCLFIYRMHQKGLISMDDIIDRVIKVDSFLTMKVPNKRKSRMKYEIDIGNSNIHSILIQWFYPELLERNIPLEKIMYNIRDLNIFSTMDKYIQKLEIFQKVRELGEPVGELDSAIFHDDVEKLKLAIEKAKSTSIENIEVTNFILCKDAKLLDYSAYCSSIKCFEYLLGVGATPTIFTFVNAIYGRSSEIIEILKKENFLSNDILTNRGFSYIFNGNAIFSNCLVLCIIFHLYDIFDYFFDESKIKLNEHFPNNGLFISAFDYSAESGNVNSLITLIDKGFNIERYLYSSLMNAGNHGFNRYVQLLLKFSHGPIKRKDISPVIIKTSSLSIYKSLIKIYKNSFIIISSLNNAIEYDNDDIVFYIIENFHKNLKPNDVISLLKRAVAKKSNRIFNYIESKFNFFDILNSEKVYLHLFSGILNIACSSNNLEAAKKLTDFIISNNELLGFTSSFIEAANHNSIEICKYFIDKKVFLNAKKIASHSKIAELGNGEFVLHLLDITSENYKKALAELLLNKTIKARKKDVVIHLLKTVKINFNSLIAAIKSNDVEMLGIVLSYNSDPSFINQITAKGTILNIAAINGNADIFKRLLLVPGIDPNLYGTDSRTPLISAIIRFNIDIVNLLLDFYGDEIQEQMWQVNLGIKTLLKRLYNGSKILFDNNMKSFKNVFHMSKNKEKICKIISLLITIKNVDLNCRGNEFTLLSFCCQNNLIEIVKNLLKFENIDVNVYSLKNGNTPLITAIENGHTEIAKLLIDYPSTNINQKNYDDYSPLAISVLESNKEIVLKLINHPKFDPAESNLNYAFMVSDSEIGEILSKLESLDINYKKTKINKKEDFYADNEIYIYETALTHSLDKEKMVDIIINHPKFDPDKSQVIEAIFLLFDDIFMPVFINEVFDKLLQTINNNVNIYNANNQSLISYLILKKKKDAVKKVLDYETFDPVKSDLLDAFITASCPFPNQKKFEGAKKYLLSDDSEGPKYDAMIDIMNMILEYDKSHSNMIHFDQLLPSGKSFFTTISTFLTNLGDLVKFYLDNGVDPNAPDKFGIYPLEYAINKSSSRFVEALLDSEKINTSIRLNENNETFLHFAMKNDTCAAFINKNAIDVNSVDAFGETPLMKACRLKRISNIALLFTKDELDFHRCNNNGDDALAICKKLSNMSSLNQQDDTNSDVNVFDKDEYLKLLNRYIMS